MCSRSFSEFYKSCRPTQFGVNLSGGLRQCSRQSGRRTRPILSWLISIRPVGVAGLKQRRGYCVIVGMIDRGKNVAVPTAARSAITSA